MSVDAELALDAGVTTPLKGIRRTAARRMVQAWAAPVFHLTVEVDMEQASRVKEVAPSATVTDVLVRAAARALVAVPEVNAHVGEDEVTTFPHANVGIAVATDKGLTVPVIHAAETLSIDEIAARRGEIVQRAREGALTRDDITGGTFTISNLGMMGVARFDAILNVPQAAILAVGATTQRSVLRDGEPQWRPIADLTLTCDHRALDGAAGARFMAAFAAELSAPLEG
jgi:pyruvate dehydrogenase E2 component (dihydrolipoamide acetyltransferase)